MGSIAAVFLCNQERYPLPLSPFRQFQLCCPAYSSILKPAHHLSGTAIEGHFLTFHDIRRIGTCFIISIHYSSNFRLQFVD
jgi:hypothetical protein